MKNILRFGLFAALATVSLSCTKETADIPAGEREMVQMTFTATNGELTKTYLDGKAVKWHESDVIGIHDGYSPAKDATKNQQFTIESINSDGSAVFKGTAAAGQEKYYATYPYDAGNFVTEEGKMRIAFMSTQIASAPGTFNQNYNSSAAVLKDGVLNFQNLGGLLKLNLTQNNVKKITLAATDGGTIGGVYYIYFDENGKIDESRTTLASARPSMALQPDGSVPFSPGTYYFVLSPRTYTGGMSITFALNNGKTITANCTEDIVVERSKITNIGTFDTTYKEEEEVFTPVSFPVVFPMGIKNSVGQNNPLVATNTWVQEWYADEACSASGKTSHKKTDWKGHHGTLYCADQPQAYMKWVWDEKIADLGITHFIETTTGNATTKISTVGVKGVWTDDYFEFVIPVQNFEANTTLSLTLSLYTREGPTFWEVLYKDGETWKSTAIENLPAYEGSTVTAKATWALQRLETSSTVDNEKRVEMTFENPIKRGEILIRVKCVDGSIQSTTQANGYVKTGQTTPFLSSGAASAPFYFWNPGKRDNHDIVIDIVNI